MNAAATWVYQPPHRPESHPGQCYYRAPRWLHMQAPGAAMTGAQLTLYRGMQDVQAQLTIDILQAKVMVDLNRSALALLRDALNDALHDIDVAEADRERRESFERIQEEMRDAGEDGTGVYYAHPDVHYVAPSQVVAKVLELEAAGAPRFVVLPDPNIVDAEFHDPAVDVPTAHANALQEQAS